MSRIYQGGQSNNTYQARQRKENFSPVQAVNNQAKIVQEGESKLRDIQTQDREAQRKNQTQNVERQAQDTTARSTLEMEQMQASNILKQQQLVENANLQTAQLAAQSELKGVQSLERGTLNIEQVKDKGVLRLNNLREQNSMKLTNMQDNLNLGMIQSAKRADMALGQQQMQLNQQLDSAKTQLIGNTIQSLISFAGTVVTEIEKNKGEQVDKDGFDALFHDPIVSSSGSIHPSITGEASIKQVERAEETAIQQVAPGDTVTQEALRGTGADQSMLRAQSQAFVAGSALDLNTRLSDLVESNPLVFDKDGRQVPLKSIRSHNEYASGVKQLVRGLYQADGIDKEDAYAGYMAYGTAARGAYNSAVATGAPAAVARAKQQRYSEGLSSGTSIHAAGKFAANAQAGWDMAIGYSTISGHHDNKTPRELNTDTLKDYMSRLPTDRIKDLLDVRKIGNRAGTEFRNSPEYEQLIKSTYTQRIKDENEAYTVTQKAQTIEVAKIATATQKAVFDAPPEQTKEIREAAIARLSDISSPQAIDEIAKLSKLGGTDPNVYQAILKMYQNREPPSDSFLGEMTVKGFISPEEKEEFKKMGLQSNQIVQAMTDAGLQSVREQVKDAVNSRLAEAGVESTERGLLNDQLTAYLLPLAESRLSSYIDQKPKPDSLQIQQKSAEIMKSLGDQVFDPSKQTNKHPLMKKGEGDGFYYLNLDTKNVAPTVNRTTGKYNRDFTSTKPSEIPKYASTNDAYLNRNDFLSSVELWDKGRPAAEYPLRVQQVAKKLGVSPTLFIRKQALALGYKSIEQVSPAFGTEQPTSMKAGYHALQSMGFPSKGAAYLSGNIMQESSWNGQQPTWDGKELNDGSDRNGGLVSWMDDAQKNHFRLRNIEKYLGKSIEQANPSEQLQAMVWEMKTTPYYKERGVFATFMNPNSTPLQLRRASKTYWGYRDEGERYVYAEALYR